MKRFCEEVIMWRNLRHPNVLRLVGATLGNNHLAMVSEWMHNGNINEFIKAHPKASQLKLVGFYPHC